MYYYDKPTNIGNVPDWIYVLELWKCCDFFEIDGTSDKLWLLLMGYTDDNIRLIIKHIPNTYDLSQWPIELLQTILSLLQYPKILLPGENSAYRTCGGYAEYNEYLRYALSKRDKLISKIKWFLYFGLISKN